MPIEAFGEKIIGSYGRADSLRIARRVVEFLVGHADVKTTFDLSAKLIPEFEARYGHLSANTRLAYLQYFRRACQLAVELGYRPDSCENML
jgi:hypothetical protein